MTAVGYHRAAPVSGRACRKLVHVQPLGGVFFLYVPLRAGHSRKSASGQGRGWDALLSKMLHLWLSVPTDNKRRFEAFMKYEVFTGIQPQYQLPAEFSENKTFWWMILIYNKKPVMAIKAMILAHWRCHLPPYSWRWFYLFLCFNIYSLLPENKNNNNTKIITFVTVVVISVFECLPYVTVFVRCFPSTSSPVITITLGECLPHFTNEENRAQGGYITCSQT